MRQLMLGEHLGTKEVRAEYENGVLTIELPVTFTEAALGANVEVPTLNGPVTLKIPAGTASGRTFRIRGKGAPKPKKGGHGDLLATVRVEVPAKLLEICVQEAMALATDMLA